MNLDAGGLRLPRPGRRHRLRLRRPENLAYQMRLAAILWLMLHRRHAVVGLFRRLGRLEH